MSEYPKPVRMGGVWLQDDGVLVGCGYEFRRVQGQKWAAEVVGVRGKVVGRLWENTEHPNRPQFSGSLSKGVRCALWLNKRKVEGDNKPNYDFQVETDMKALQENGQSAPANDNFGGGTGVSDDIPFMQLDERLP